jgi:DSBA-like thioredoxin domain
MERYGRALNLTESALAKAACAAGPVSSATPLSKSILNPVQRMWNTGLSHILVQLAGQQEQKHHEHSAVAGHSQLQTAMVEAIFKAHFEQGLNISDAAVLIALAEEVGVTGAAEALSCQTVAEQVASFQAAAKAEGAAGVPYFTVKRQHYPGRFRFCGAQPTSTFVQAFQKLLLDRTQLVTAIRNKMATAAAEAEAAAVSALLGAAVASSPTDEQLAVVESFKHSRSTGHPYGSSGSGGSVQQRHSSASPTTTQQMGPAFRPLKKRQRLSEDATSSASAAAAVTVQQQQQQHSSSGSGSSSSGDKQDALPAPAHVKQNNNSNSTDDSNSGYYQYGHFHTGHHGEQLHHEAQQQQQQQRPSSYSRQMFSQQQGYNTSTTDTAAKDSQVKTDNSPASSSSSGMLESTTSVSAGATITVVDQPAVAPSSCTMTSTTAVATTSTQGANTQQQQQQQQRQQQGWFLAGMRHLS